MGQDGELNVQVCGKGLAHGCEGGGASAFSRRCRSGAAAGEEANLTEKIGYLLTPRLFHMQNSSGFASPTRGRDASAGRLGWNYSRRGHPIRR
jgi:hypothetical protein